MHRAPNMTTDVIINYIVNYCRAVVNPGILELCSRFENVWGLMDSQHI